MKPDPYRFALVMADDWQALYVHGHAVSQDHEISADELLELAEKHGFTHSSLARIWANDEDVSELMDCGNFPEHLSDLKSPLK